MQARLSLTVVLAFFLYVCCVVAAILLQDHTSLLPLGLFNDGRPEYDLLSNAALAVFSTLLLIFGFELFQRRTTLAGRLARATLASMLLLEAALSVFDVGWVSRDPHGRFGGPYFERRTQDGSWIFLPKGPAGSEFGFRTPRAEPRRSTVPRLLFLGDSYTQGSGSDLACNYPAVVEEELTRRLGTPLEVMNAGVAGYGPVDAWKLLRFLDDEGFHFDAIVFNLFLENDFTDNLPATERRVVAGINFRFPTSGFLRAFHPLNHRVFRYALFVRTASPLTAPAPVPARPDLRRCRTGPEPTGPLDGPFRTLVERKLEANYAVPMDALSLSEVRRAVTSMQAFADAHDVPLVLVVFPDRILADSALRRELRLEERGRSWELDRLQRWVRESFPSLPQIDVTETLAGSLGAYRASDTHLSDSGNLRAGEFVGRRLAEILGPGLQKRDGSDPGDSVTRFAPNERRDPE